MPGQFNSNQNSEEALNQYRVEFISSVLEEENNYLWNPQESQLETLLSEIEEDFSLTDCLEAEEVDSLAENLFASLDRCWSNSKQSSFRKSLSQKFANFVPSAWLETIAKEAEKVVTSNLTSVQQLVQCVQPLFDDWAEEDLQVFARPLAYAMRGNDDTAVESAIKLMKRDNWDNISDMQKIRIGMAIAHYALEQLQED
jgi:hypothetical protein